MPALAADPVEGGREREVTPRDRKPPSGDTRTPQQVIVAPPTGLAYRQSATEIVLTWRPVQDAKEYHVFIDPPPQPWMAVQPAIVGGNGGHYVIPTRGVPPGTVYRAAIRTHGNNGTISDRVSFPPVAVAAGGGTPSSGSGPTTSGTSPTAAAGQQCPAGQFVTGFTSTGSLICAAPPR